MIFETIKKMVVLRGITWVGGSGVLASAFHIIKKSDMNSQVAGKSNGSQSTLV
jgi:hypothetical protein